MGPVPMDGAEAEQLGDGFPVDFEVASWYTSTYPSSRFVTTLTAQRARPEGRHVLRNLAYTFRVGETVTERTLSREELVPFLAATFGIDLPAGTRFAALDGPGPPAA